MEFSISSDDVDQLMDDLVQKDGQERFAFIRCGVDGHRLLVNQVDVVDDEDLERQGRIEVRPDTELERDRIKEIFDDGYIPVFAHSHPFSEKPNFSGADVEIMERFKKWLTGLYPEKPFGFAVVGRGGFNLSVYSPEEDQLVYPDVDIVGEWALPGSSWTSSGSSEVAFDVDRYDRNIRALGEDGQHRLAETHVAVVGCGGLGSVMVEELARLGVNELTLIDPDVVEESNLPRLVGVTPQMVGRPKVNVLQNHCWEIRSDIEVNTVAEPVEDCRDTVKAADIILGAVDQVSTRSWLNEHAVRFLQPYIDAGVRIQTSDGHINSMDGFVQVVAPGATACFDCLSRGNPEQERLEEMDPEQREESVDRGYVDEDVLEAEPAVIQLNGQVASIAVNELVKVVTEYGEPTPFLHIDMADNSSTPMQADPGDGCSTCGELRGRGMPPVDNSSENVVAVDPPSQF